MQINWIDFRFAWRVSAPFVNLHVFAGCVCICECWNESLLQSNSDFSFSSVQIFHEIGETCKCLIRCHLILAFASTDETEKKINRWFHDVNRYYSIIIAYIVWLVSLHGFKRLHSKALVYSMNLVGESKIVSIFVFTYHCRICHSIFGVQNFHQP